MRALLASLFILEPGSALSPDPPKCSFRSTVKDLVAGAGFEFVDIGEQSLKGVPTPWRVFSVVQPESESAPDPRTIHRSHNLPVQLTTFVGRDDDLIEADRLLADARLLTLTGVGGSGKTRLALQLAAAVLEDYEAGAWLVELAPITDPELIPQTVLAMLGAKDHPGRSPAETISISIGSKKLLLVFDNCEHLVDAAAELAAFLLSRCPNLKIVATSREILGVPGEVPFEVEALAVPDVSDNRDALMEFDSVKLYTERALTVQTGFQVTENNAKAVADICRRLDGMPLALELAAARMRVMSPEQIARRLDDRFALLTGGARTALPRQQTLLATVDWSYRLLEPDEKEMFQILSVFAGGFSLQVVEAVCAEDGRSESAVADLIQRLADKSLLMVGEGLEGAVRYRLLETLREYASAELTESGQADQIRSRHAKAFGALVEKQRRLVRAGDSDPALDQLAVETDNIRAALRWTIDQSDLGTMMELGKGMALYWNRRGFFSEGIEWTSEILERIPGSSDADQALFHRILATSQYMMGDYGSAKVHDEEALEAYRRLEDIEGSVRSLTGLAFIADNVGEYDAQRTYVEEALELVTAEPVPEFPTQILVATLGWAAWKSGDMETARSKLQRALDDTEDGVLDYVEDYLFGLAFVSWTEGDPEDAEQLAREAVRLADEQGLIHMSAGYQFAVALFAYDQGKASIAAAVLRESWPTILDSVEGMWVPHWLYVAARAQPDPVSLVRILGAVDVLNGRTGFMFGIPIREDRDRFLERARVDLGPEAFEKAWVEGSSASVVQAGEWALEGLQHLET